MTEIPGWPITGDWFDNCRCAVACPCTFAQATDNGVCESVLFWHVRHGQYGDIDLDNLSFVLRCRRALMLKPACGATDELVQFRTSVDTADRHG